MALNELSVTFLLQNFFFNFCIRLKNERTHIVNENGSILDSMEERSVAGILEVASVPLIGSFVQSLLPRNASVIWNMQKNITESKLVI